MNKYYELLDINPDASHSEIRLKFLQKIRITHPDKSGGKTC